MNAEQFSEALGELDGGFVEMAVTYRPRAKKQGFVKWASMAACLCLILALALLLPGIYDPGVDPLEPTDALSQAEQIKSQITRWQAEGYRGVVVDPEDNSVYPLSAESMAFLGENAQIVLSNGIEVITIVYAPQEAPDTE